MRAGASSLTLAALALAGCGGDKAADPRAIVSSCTACHSFEAGGARRAGPNLHGLLGQPAGQRPGFASSAAMKESGIVWTSDTLDAFIADPDAVVPGNRMGFRGEPDAAKRRAIIAYMTKEGAR